MALKKLPPRIEKICTECGHDLWSHSQQEPIMADFGNGKSKKAWKMRCRICKTDCGLSCRIGFDTG